MFQLEDSEDFDVNEEDFLTGIFPCAPTTCEAFPLARDRCFLEQDGREIKKGRKAEAGDSIPVSAKKLCLQWDSSSGQADQWSTGPRTTSSAADSEAETWMVEPCGGSEAELDASMDEGVDELFLQQVDAVEAVKGQEKAEEVTCVDSSTVAKREESDIVCGRDGYLHSEGSTSGKRVPPVSAQTTADKASVHIVCGAAFCSPVLRVSGLQNNDLFSSTPDDHLLMDCQRGNRDLQHNRGNLAPATLTGNQNFLNCVVSARNINGSGYFRSGLQDSFSNSSSTQSKQKASVDTETASHVQAYAVVKSSEHTVEQGLRHKSSGPTLTRRSTAGDTSLCDSMLSHRATPAYSNSLDNNRSQRTLVAGAIMETHHLMSENTRDTDSVNCKVKELSLMKMKTRKFPGPAGVLPQMSTRLKISPVVEQEPLACQTPSLLLPEAPLSQCSDAEFDKAPWLGMREDFELDHANTMSVLQRFTISWVKRTAAARQLYTRKIPFLALLVKLIDYSLADACACFSDRTGEIHGSVHHDLLENYGEQIQPGSVLVLRQVAVLSTGVSSRRHYLNITPSNVVCIYSLKDNGELERTHFSAVTKEEILQAAREMAKVSKSSGEKENSLLSSVASESPQTVTNALYFSHVAGRVQNAKSHRLLSQPFQRKQSLHPHVNGLFKKQTNIIHSVVTSNALQKPQCERSYTIAGAQFQQRSPQTGASVKGNWSLSSVRCQRLHQSGAPQPADLGVKNVQSELRVGAPQPNKRYLNKANVGRAVVPVSCAQPVKKNTGTRFATNRTAESKSPAGVLQVLSAATVLQNEYVCGAPVSSSDSQASPPDLTLVEMLQGIDSDALFGDF